MNTQENTNTPARHDGITLTGHQLLQALEFTAPDRETDAQQLETEVRIEYMPERTAHNGEAMPAGDFIYLIDYPEEGVVQLHAEPPEGDSARTLTDAARDVLAERQRQVGAEGYDHAHDDAHACDEIAALAAWYAMPPAARYWSAESTGYGDTWGDALLPEGWSATAGDRRRELVKAGALILAEIERLDRAPAANQVGAEGA